MNPLMLESWFESWLVRMSLAGGGVLLLGALWMLITRQPARQQRIGELALFSSMVIALGAGLPAWWSWDVPLTQVDEPGAMAFSASNNQGITATIQEDTPALMDAVQAQGVGQAAVQTRGTGLSSTLWRWLTYIGWGYLILVGFLLVRCGLANVMLWYFRQYSRPAPALLHVLLDELVVAGQKRPRLGVCDRVPCPVSFGLQHPTILLPSKYCHDHERDVLRGFLAHELTHLERRDPWSILLLALGGAVYFHLPWFWWLRRRIRLAQEYIADAAAARWSSAVEYAQSLVAASVQSVSCPLINRHAAGIFERQSDLSRRITMLLSNAAPPERSCPQGWSWLVAASFLTMATLTSGIKLYAEDPTPVESAQAAEWIIEAEDAAPGNLVLGRAMVSGDDGKSEVQSVLIISGNKIDAITAQPLLVQGFKDKIDLIAVEVDDQDKKKTEPKTSLIIVPRVQAGMVRLEPSLVHKVIPPVRIQTEPETKATLEIVPRVRAGMVRLEPSLVHKTLPSVSTTTTAPVVRYRAGLLAPSEDDRVKQLEDALRKVHSALEKINQDQVEVRKALEAAKKALEQSRKTLGQGRLEKSDDAALTARVRAGQLLIDKQKKEIETKKAQADAAQASAAVAEANKLRAAQALEALKAEQKTVTTARLRSVEAARQSAEAQHAAALRRFEQAQQLTQKGYASQSELDKSKASVREAQAQRDQAFELMKQAEKGAREERNPALHQEMMRLYEARLKQAQHAEHLARLQAEQAFKSATQSQRTEKIAREQADAKASQAARSQAQGQEEAKKLRDELDLYKKKLREAEEKLRKFEKETEAQKKALSNSLAQSLLSEASQRDKSTLSVAALLAARNQAQAEQQRAVEAEHRAQAEKQKATALESLVRARYAEAAKAADAAKEVKAAKEAKAAVASRGRLGVNLDTVSSALATQLDLGEGKGLVILEVYEGTPAAVSGLKSNDILLEFAGKAVPGNTEDFRKQVSGLKEGVFDARIIRKGKRMTIKGIELTK